MLITFDFGGTSLCHEILHFVQKSLSSEASLAMSIQSANFIHTVLAFTNSRIPGKESSLP
uniref:Uncharacterized protein n=1 Tax=Candidatus Kentrum sp. LPFa TaxID=2126335 RepID=A0A450WQ62_9GAMM|nr:MAG: hypothetical protein BECKLPF1236B_GA0070989_11642 [Candidatus Kentron sp. LPFa]